MSSTAATDPNRPSPDWTPVDQLGHTALWSAHLGMPDSWRAGRFLKRYWIMSVPLVADLLKDEFTGPRECSTSSIDSSVRSAYCKLALWALSPYFESTLRNNKNTNELRYAFRHAFCHEPATFPSDGPNRPLLPAVSEVYLEGATVRTRPFRRSAQVRVKAEVLQPFSVLRAMVYPWNWGSCPFWTDLPKEEAEIGKDWAGKIEPSIRLPGGLFTESSKAKERAVSMNVEVASGSFAARVDYDGEENPVRNKERLRGSEEWEWQDGQRGKRPERRNVNLNVIESVLDKSGDRIPVDYLTDYELGKLSGSLLVEKMPGRPNTCRVVLERTVRFNDPNHAYFDKQTLWYWAAAELIAFIDQAVKKAQ